MGRPFRRRRICGCRIVRNTRDPCMDGSAEKASQPGEGPCARCGSRCFAASGVHPAEAAFRRPAAGGRAKSRAGRLREHAGVSCQGVLTRTLPGLRWRPRVHHTQPDRGLRHAVVLGTAEGTRGCQRQNAQHRTAARRDLRYRRPRQRERVAAPVMRGTRAQERSRPDPSRSFPSCRGARPWRSRPAGA